MSIYNEHICKFSKFFLNFLNLSVNCSQKPMGSQSPLTHAASVPLAALRAQLTSSPCQPLPAGSSQRRCQLPSAHLCILGQQLLHCIRLPASSAETAVGIRQTLSKPSRFQRVRRENDQTHLLRPKVTTGDNIGALSLPREKETFHLMTHHQG